MTGTITIPEGVEIKAGAQFPIISGSTLTVFISEAVQKDDGIHVVAYLEPKSIKQHQSTRIEGIIPEGQRSFSYRARKPQPKVYMITFEPVADATGCP